MFAVYHSLIAHATDGVTCPQGKWVIWEGKKVSYVFWWLVLHLAGFVELLATFVGRIFFTYMIKNTLPASKE